MAHPCYRTLGQNRMASPPCHSSGGLALGGSDSVPVPRADSQPQAVAGDRDTKEPDKWLEPWQDTAGQRENKPESGKSFLS